MKRQARLQSARSWIPTYGGRNIVRSYARWFGVSRLCAAIELTMLGVDLPPGQVDKERQAEEAAARARQRCARERAVPPEPLQDEDLWPEFMYVDGTTPAGFPYGITWEEWDASSGGTTMNRSTRTYDPDDPPF